MHLLFHSEHGLSKKERKLAQRKRSVFHQRMFFLLQLRHSEEKLARDIERSHKTRKSENKSDKEWIGKVATVRNRLTGKKRDSKERWNRFAGTAESGGRGL
jgi:hypothetical protein